MAQTTRKPKKKGDQTAAVEKLEPKIHRRILKYLNDATRPQDLVHPPEQVFGHEDLIHEDNPELAKRQKEPVLDHDVAREVFEHREGIGPYGFHHLGELLEVRVFTRLHLEHLLHWFGHIFYGHWDTLPYDTQQPNGTSVDVGHAAVLHTGKVLFIPADYQSAGWPTPIWDPSDEVNPQFEYPVGNPAYSLFCSGHSFLSDGKLLVLGGGGDRNVTPSAVWGYKFDPGAKTWTRTSGAMSEYRWYPTAVTLGDHRVLVTCGSGSGHMEAYVEATDSFVEIAGDTRGFPNLYPGLHLLPNHAIFYSRTGWGSAGANLAFNDNTSAFFTFDPSDPLTGSWTNVTPSTLNRAKAMSVTILSPTFPTVRILAIGGVDSFGNGLSSAEIFDASVLTGSSSWTSPIPVPDGEARRQCNAVLLPDGTVFVSGGINRVNSPCTMFDPASNGWRPMDELPSIRGYHSVSLLLPSGKVLVAGGDNNPRIEVFSPPYLFRGPRPAITATPSLVHHGQTFSIESPDAADIVKVVFVRPSAVTHQTDTEQRVIVVPFLHDHVQPNRIQLTAPHGGHPHSLAPQGYYMLFVLNQNSVPSVGRWIYLH
jgi:hypothetical protein